MRKTGAVWDARARTTHILLNLKRSSARNGRMMLIIVVSTPRVRVYRVCRVGSRGEIEFVIKDDNGTMNNVSD